MASICRFIPQKSGQEFKTVHFVLETELKKLRQPFIHPFYCMFLVTKGEGVLTLPTGSRPLSVGTLFFAFPGTPYEISGSSDLTYMYISFMGERAQKLMQGFGIDPSHPTLEGFSNEIPFWRTAIQRVDHQNADVLSECVLLYTFSFIDGDKQTAKTRSHTVVDSIVSYVDNHFNDPDLSLKKIADIFAYTDKYLSRIFKETMNINFNKHLTNVRIQRATELMTRGNTDTDKLAVACGYHDPTYFSKVFKRQMKKTPKEYMESLKTPE